MKEGVPFAAEAPFIWRGTARYWAVVKDNAGHFTNRGYSLALWESADGLDWKLAKHPLVATPEIAWADGRQQKLDALERPQLLLENSQPIALFCAAADAKGRDGPEMSGTVIDDVVIRRTGLRTPLCRAAARGESHVPGRSLAGLCDRPISPVPFAEDGRSTRKWMARYGG